MKRALVILSGLIVLVIACGDSSEPVIDQLKSTGLELKDGVNITLADRIYDEVDQLPLFAGCETMECSNKELISYIIDNVKYPKSALDATAEGKVFVQFVIDTKGYVKHIEVKKSPHESLSQESVKVVQSFNAGEPLWSPGIQDGQEVAVRYTLPFSYKAES